MIIVNGSNDYSKAKTINRRTIIWQTLLQEQ